jgi:hypothetical protein
LNSYEFGAGLGLALFIVGWITWMEIRFRNLQSQLLVSQEEVKDAEIEAKDRALSPAELDALLTKELGGSESSS